MKLAIIAFTACGAKLGRTVANQLENATLHVPSRLAEELGEIPYQSLHQWTADHWGQVDGPIFIGATGIAVRGVAPYIKDKFSDPAIISLDEQGRFIIPLLSGHVGGGNQLAEKLATLTGGQAVISTATDINGIFAVDVWAKEQKLTIGDRTVAKEISAALLEGKSVGFASDCGYPCPEGLMEDHADLGVWVSAKKVGSLFGRTLPLVPKVLTLGIGCRRGTSQEAIQSAVDAVLSEYHFAAVSQVATIDLKQDEGGLLAFCRDRQLPLVTFSAEELQLAQGQFTPSDFVASVTGVDNVCERAAVLAGGTLILPKWAKNGVTVAVAERNIV